MELTIDEDLYERLSTRAKRNGFESTEMYAETILTIVLDELEDQRTDEVQDRLEDLGYL